MTQIMKSRQRLIGEFRADKRLQSSFADEGEYVKFVAAELSRETVREAWDFDILLRREFSGNFEAYYYFVRAELEGKVSSVGKTVSG